MVYIDITKPSLSESLGLTQKQVEDIITKFTEDYKTAAMAIPDGQDYHDEALMIKVALEEPDEVSRIIKLSLAVIAASK